MFWHHGHQAIMCFRCYLFQVLLQTLGSNMWSFLAYFWFQKIRTAGRPVQSVPSFSVTLSCWKICGRMKSTSSWWSIWSSNVSMYFSALILQHRSFNDLYQEHQYTNPVIDPGFWSKLITVWIMKLFFSYLVRSTPCPFLPRFQDLKY